MERRQRLDKINRDIDNLKLYNTTFNLLYKNPSASPSSYDENPETVPLNKLTKGKADKRSSELPTPKHKEGHTGAEKPTKSEGKCDTASVAAKKTERKRQGKELTSSKSISTSKVKTPAVIQKGDVEEVNLEKEEKDKQEDTEVQEDGNDNGGSSTSSKRHSSVSSEILDPRMLRKLRKLEKIKKLKEELENDSSLNESSDSSSCEVLDSSETKSAKDGQLKCEECQKTFSNRSNWVRHHKQKHQDERKSKGGQGFKKK